MTQMWVVMGVSGCGKSMVGQALAARLSCPFYDADDFHTPENIARMRRGIPLNDENRTPWLARLAALIDEHLTRQETAVLACSALKKSYRNRLRAGHQNVRFIYLDGEFDLIWQRMQARQNHFMKAKMLRSQFNALEKPDADEALIFNVETSVEDVLGKILEEIRPEPEIEPDLSQR